MPVAATNSATTTPVFNALVSTSVRLRARHRGFRGVEQNECCRHALDRNRQIQLLGLSFPLIVMLLTLMIRENLLTRSKNTARL